MMMLLQSYALYCDYFNNATLFDENLFFLENTIYIVAWLLIGSFCMKIK